MKNRKRGFSLVELLIVLAVIAALIATITPVALNAIRKAQATKVAQNIKTLAAAIENAAYVNGVEYDSGVKKIKSGSGATDFIDTITDLGRDIDDEKYGIKYQYDETSKEFKVAVFSSEEVDFATAQGVVSGLVNTLDSSYFSGTTVELGYTGTGNLYYTFEFDLY